ncbi:MAG: hypothetical protein WAU88_05825, partial [Candidatus Zixiibacteriota bacterium]
MRTRALSQSAILLLALCGVFGPSGGAQVIGTYQPAYWSSPGSNSVFLVKDTGSGQSYAGGSVDPYTGQHSEAFRLFSLKGRGNISVDLSLRYSGTVKGIVSAQNYRQQASTFGLGFNLVTSAGIEYIRVDHGNTASIWDDSYQLVIDGSPTEMKRVPGSSDEFVLSDGRCWKILRHRAHNSNHLTEPIFDMVMGFEITDEDGTIFQLGDLDPLPANWNATQNIALFGRDVRPGFARADSVEAYPYEWYLKSVHDAENLNSIQFKYSRDSFQIGEENPPNTQGTGKFATRATYLTEVSTSDGQKILLDYVDREDKQPNYFSRSTFNNISYRTGLFDFYREKRIDQISLVSRSGQVISKVQFDMGYLNLTDNGASGSLNKLILKSFYLMSGNGSQSIPPYRFEYYEDLHSVNAGSLRRITYPSAAVKELTYRLVPDDSNYTKLDAPVDLGAWGWTDRLTATVSENLFLGSHYADNLTLPMQGANWDGYWRSIGFEAGKDQFQYEPMPWNDGWFAYYRSDGANSSIRIKRWMGGYWNEVSVPFQVDSYHVVTLHPDKNGFLVEAYNRISGGDPSYYYYRWNGQNWLGFPIKTGLGSNGRWHAKVQAGVFVVSYTQGSSVHLVLGKYDPALDNIVTFEPSVVPFLVNDSNIAIGPDLACWLTASRALIYRYNDTLSTWTSAYTSPVYSDVYGIAVFPFGVCWSYRSGSNIRLVTAKFTSTIDQFSIRDDIDGNVNTNKLVATNHTLFFGTGMYEWSGDSWRNPFLFYQPNAREASLYPEGIRYKGAIAGQPRPHTRPFLYLGDGDWWSGPLFSDTLSASSGDHFVIDCNTATSSGGRSLYLWDQLYAGEDQLSNLGQIGDFQHNGGYGSSAIVGTTVSVISSETPNAGDNPYIHLYKCAYRTFQGKAPLLVVDTVKLLDYVGDNNPVIQTFSFSAGLVDQSGTIPRFGKVAVSLPHYLRDVDTIAYVELHYFNDIDTLGFYNSSVYNAGTWFPDLKDADRYGVSNGGFRLDGRLYLSDSYTRIRNGAQFANLFSRDSTQYHYRLSTTPVNVFDVYRIQLAKVVTQSDGVTATHKFTYHPTSGLVTASWTQDSQERWQVDSTTYAADGSSAMQSDHALSQEGSRATFSWSLPNTYTLVNASHMLYSKKGAWQLSQSSTDLLGSGQTIDEFRAVGFDAYGNATLVKDARGVSSGVIYDSSASKSLAIISNGGPQDCLVQDFEQGPVWGNWLIGTNLQGFLTSDAFTGKKCFRMIDDPSTAERNWGPARDLSVDSLTDTMYHFSCWVKSNYDVTILCLCASDANGTLCPNGYKTVSIPGENLSASQWTLVQGDFHIADVMPSLHHIRVQLSLDNSSPSDPNDFALFDDFRFLPKGALVATTVYDPETGQATAQADFNNVPTRYAFDKLLRARSSRDYLSQSLDSISYQLKADSLSSYTIWHSEMKNQSGVYADTLIATTAMNCRYYFNRVVLTGSGGLFKNDVNPFGPGVIVYRTCLDSEDPSESLTGTFSVVPGDKIIFRYFDSELGDDPSATIDVVGRIGTYPERILTPNYTWLSRHLSANDSTQVVTFTDGNGSTIESRTYSSISGGDTTTIVSAARYDARGRKSRQYKNYYVHSPGASVFEFDDSTTVQSEASTYYSTNGPDCGQYPYTEYGHDPDQLGRLNLIRYPGSFRQHPTQFANSSSAAPISSLSDPFYAIDSLFKQKTVNEDGHSSVSYIDKTGRLLASVLDSSEQGINAATIHFADFAGRDTLIIQPEGHKLR